MIARIFLGLTALMFFAFGAWSLFNPVGMTGQLGVELAGPSAVFEMRGIYGGVSLGAGILCLIGALHTRYQFAGLIFVATYMGGYVIGRAASFIAGDTAGASNWAFAGFEALMFAAALLLSLRQK